MSVRSSRRTPLINGAVVDAHVAIFDGTTGAIKDGGVPAGTGTVTNSGTLTSNQLIIGGGTTVVSALGTLGTTSTVLHGNAAGAPTYGAVALGSEVSGDLPFANFVQSSAASKLVGRGSASGAGDFEEVSLGTGLSMSGTTLSATGSGGTVTTTGSPANGNLTKFSGSTSITNADLTGDVTTSGGVATTIANGVVTLAKIANAAANSKLVGSGSSGSGASYSELTVGSGLSISGTTLSASGAASGRTTLQFQFGASAGWNPGDGAVAYFGTNVGFNPNAATDGGYRVISPITGTVTAVYGQIQVTGTLGSSGINSTLTMRNVTANGTENISTTLDLSVATINFSNTAMTLAVTAGDALVMKWTMGTWAVNPTAVFGYFTVVLA